MTTRLVYGIIGSMKTATGMPRQEEILSLMKANYRLQYVEEDDLRTLLSHCHLKSFAKGSHVFLEGDTVESLYIVVSGRVELNMNNHKFEEKLFSILHPGQLLGLPEIFNCHGIHTTNALCDEDCTFAVVSKDTFRSLIFSLPSLSFALLVLMGNMIGELRHELSLSGAEARILSYLKELLTRHAGEVDGPVKIPRPVSFEKLARMLNITRETTSRVFNNLQNRGVLDIGRDHYVIRDTALVLDATPPHSCLSRDRE